MSTAIWLNLTQAADIEKRGLVARSRRSASVTDAELERQFQEWRKRKRL